MPNGTVVELSPVRIVGYEDQCNLRELSWNQKALERIKTGYDLLHGEGVIFANKARTRFRLVIVFHGMPYLVLPPIDPKDKVSLYLKEAQFLRKFRITSETILKYIDEEIELAEGRLERRRQRAAAALQRRKNR